MIIVLQIFASHSVRTAHARTHTRHIQPVPPTTHPQMAAATGLSWLCAPWSGGERRSSRERPPRTTRYRCCWYVVVVKVSVAGRGTAAQLAPATVFSSFPPPQKIRPRTRTVQYYCRRTIIIVRTLYAVKQ